MRGLRSHEVRTPDTGRPQQQAGRFTARLTSGAHKLFCCSVVLLFCPHPRAPDPEFSAAPRAIMHHACHPAPRLTHDSLSFTRPPSPAPSTSASAPATADSQYHTHSLLRTGTGTGTQTPTQLGLHPATYRIAKLTLHPPHDTHTGTGRPCVVGLAPGVGPRGHARTKWLVLCASGGECGAWRGFRNRRLDLVSGCEGDEAQARLSIYVCTCMYRPRSQMLN